LGGEHQVQDCLHQILQWNLRRASVDRGCCSLQPGLDPEFD
jgi:hypothetical protein